MLVENEEVDPLPDNVVGLGVHEFFEQALLGRLQRWPARLAGESQLRHPPVQKENLRSSLAAL